MEIKVEGSKVVLEDFNNLRNNIYHGPYYTEEFTAYELDKLIEKLKDASKQARSNQRKTP